jgi:hypothetical protein
MANPLDLRSANCPISAERFEHPVAGPCGHTFEKVNILQYIEFNRGSVSCPVCRAPLKAHLLVDNYSLRDVLEEIPEALRRHDANRPAPSLAQRVEPIQSPPVQQQPSVITSHAPEARIYYNLVVPGQAVPQSRPQRNNNIVYNLVIPSGVTFDIGGIVCTTP